MNILIREEEHDNTRKREATARKVDFLKPNRSGKRFMLDILHALWNVNVHRSFTEGLRCFCSDKIQHNRATMIVWRID